MSQLTPRERAFVSLGAAMGSNCVSCIEHHVPASRTAGLSDAEIAEAIDLADKVRQVPARKTLEAAAGLLSNSARSAAAKPSCCG
jgi:AhpD family alkylhydroperoxidase